MALPKEPQFVPEKLQQALHSLLTVLPEISTAMEERFGNVPPPYDPIADRSTPSSLQPSSVEKQLAGAGNPQLVTSTTIPEIDTPLDDCSERARDYFVVPTAAVFTTMEWEWDTNVETDGNDQNDLNHDHAGHNDNMKQRDHNTTFNEAIYVNGTHESNGHDDARNLNRYHHQTQTTLQQPDPTVSTEMVSLL